MKPAVKFLIYSLLLYCIGCQNNEQTTKIEYVETFKEDTTVIAKDVNWIDNYQTKGILCIDTFLILLNKKGDFVFDIYNTQQKKLITKSGTFGRGPSEFERPRITRQFFKNKKGTFFYLWDDNKRYFYTINLQKLISGNDFIEKKERLSNKLSFQTQIIKIDSIIIGSTMMKEGSIFKYNLISSKIDFWPDYPNDEKYKKLNEAERYNLFGKYWIYNEKTQQLAGSYENGINQLGFFNLDGECLKSIMLPTVDYHFNAKRFNDEAPRYAAGTCGNEETIYVSYRDHPLKEQHDAKGLICVFDWNGKPIKQYLIKNTLFASFAIDSINNKVYGYAPDNDNRTIFEFDL